jgi:hypothetical protein
MKDIFERANRTLAWLGEPAPNNGAAFDLIKDFLRANGKDLWRRISELRDVNGSAISAYG